MAQAAAVEGTAAELTAPLPTAADLVVEAAAGTEVPLGAERRRRVTFADEAEVRPLLIEEDDVRSLAATMSLAEAVAMYANRKRSEHELQLQEERDAAM